MKIFFILLFFFLTSCSSKKSNLEIDVTQLKKEGVTILQNNNLPNKPLESSNSINEVMLYIESDYKKLINNQYPAKYYSSFVVPQKIDIKFSILKKDNNFSNINSNYFKRKVVSYNDKFIYGDDTSNIFIVDENLQLIKKFSIYNKNNFKNYYFNYSLIVNNDLLYVSDNLGGIYCFSLKDYSLLWKNNFDVPFLSNIEIHKNSIYVTNANGKIYSFNLSDGKQNWSFETGTEIIKTNNSYKILIYNNKLLFSNDLGFLYCIDLESQSLLWSFNFLQSINSNTFLFELADLVLENDNLYLASSFGEFFKINLNNGKILWSIQGISSIVSPVINPKTVLIVDKDNHLIIFDKEQGKILYKNSFSNFSLKNKSSFVINNIFLSFDKIYLTSINGYLLIIKSSDLKNLEIKKIADSINSNIVVNKSNIFFLGEKGYFYKLQ